ncbi:MAG: tetratricopeptide repeat protein, partial [Minicystis sp.]
MRPPPAAVTAVQAKRPTIVRVDGQLWVVGLPPRHAWARERRVLLSQRDPRLGVDVKVGVAIVLDESYASAAPVTVEYEEPGASFDGAIADIVPAEQRLRIGRGFGSIASVQSTILVEITLGRDDGVKEGDVYVVRSQDGQKPVGRVEVIALDATRSRARVVNQGPLAAGLDVVYQPRGKEEPEKRSRLRIVVCDFEPKARDPEVIRAGQSFAFDLTKHLKEAAGSWNGLEVTQVPEMVSEHEGARTLGRKHHADIVVWGTALCSAGTGCAQPVFTVVEPGRVAHAEMSGKEVRFDLLSPGGALEKGTARDPAGLVFGLLGSLAYDAQHYGDAVYYLERVPQGALDGDDYFRGLRDLGDSQYYLGRIEAALETARKLELVARGKARVWEAAGVGNRARILKNKGQVDEALKLHKEALAVYEALGDRRSRAMTLGDIARILTDKGQVDEALKLHKEALAVYEALGDRRQRAIALGDIARILKDKGQVDEALKLLKEALAVDEALGDRRQRAIALGDIAR